MEQDKNKDPRQNPILDPPNKRPPVVAEFFSSNAIESHFEHVMPQPVSEPKEPISTGEPGQGPVQPQHRW